MLVTGETWGENVEEVRAYLVQEAEQPFAVLRPKLESARDEFRTSFDGLSDAQAQFTPPTGEGEDGWGVAEVLRHIASVEPLMAERVRLLGTGQSVEGLRRTHPGYLQDVDSRRIGELRSALDKGYSDLLAAIDAIDGQERLDTDTLAAHRRFGELNCRGWVAMHTLHLRDHARQIERLKQQPGYPASQ